MRLAPKGCNYLRLKSSCQVKVVPCTHLGPFTPQRACAGPMCLRQFGQWQHRQRCSGE